MESFETKYFTCVLINSINCKRKRAEHNLRLPVRTKEANRHRLTEVVRAGARQIVVQVLEVLVMRRLVVRLLFVADAFRAQSRPVADQY